MSLAEPTIQELVNRLEMGEQRFRSIEDKLDKICAATAPIEEMKKDVSATKDIVEAWATVKNAGRFIKWLSGVVLAFVAMIAAIKVGISNHIGG